MTTSSTSIVVVAVIVANTTAGSASAIPETLKEMKLIGKWSTDCSSDASPHINVFYEIAPDGRVTIDNGLSITVLNATSMSPEGDLILQTDSFGGEKIIRILTLRRSGDTLRPIANPSEPNDYLTSKGKFIASLKDSSLLRRCDG